MGLFFFTILQKTEYQAAIAAIPLFYIEISLLPYENPNIQPQ